MGNVLDPSKQQQVLALGRLGWPLRRIEQETGVRRETGERAICGRPGSPCAAAGDQAKRRQNRPFRRRRCPPTPRAPWPPPGRAPVRQRLRAVPRADRRRRSAAGATRWRSGRTWSTTTASPRATPASGASCGSCAAARRVEARVVITTAAGRGGAGRLRRGADGARTRRRASTAARGSSS